MSDLPATVEIVRRHDVHWFGAQEQDQDEVGQFFDQVGSLVEHSLVLLDGERMVAVALWTATDTWQVVDPHVEVALAPHELVVTVLVAPFSVLVEPGSRGRVELFQGRAIHVADDN